MLNKYLNCLIKGWCMTKALRRWENLYSIMRMEDLQISFTEQIFNQNLIFCQKFLKMCKF